MAVDVIVPEVGEVGMEVTFVRWLKSEGDAVDEGDPLFEVDTAKSVMEVQAFAAGRLADLQAGEGDVVQPHQVIARLLQDADGANVPTDQPPGGPPTPSPATSTPPGAMGAGGGRPSSGPGATPRARGLARELGVDLGTVAGSGSDGLITERDVQDAAAASPSRAATPPAVEGPELPGTSLPSARTADDETRSSVDSDRAAKARRGVAELTVSAWRTIPHFYLRLDADVTAAIGEARPTTLICAAAARALARHPECNLEWEGTELVRRDRLDLGLLVDTPQGLLLPRVVNADRLTLADLDVAIDAAVTRARTGTLKTVDFGPRSLTVSNLGMFAVDSFAGVIAAPDVMLLSVGRFRTVPVWDGQAFEPRQIVELTLSVDHRAIDGADAGRFLTTLESLLREPAGLA